MTNAEKDCILNRYTELIAENFYVAAVANAFPDEDSLLAALRSSTADTRLSLFFNCLPFPYDADAQAHTRAREIARKKFRRDYPGHEFDPDWHNWQRMLSIRLTEEV